jgi:hypothetical protein
MGGTRAFGDDVVFVDYFRGFPDPRQAGKVVYPLDEALLLSLPGVLAGAEAFTADDKPVFRGTTPSDNLLPRDRIPHENTKNSKKS